MSNLKKKSIFSDFHVKNSERSVTDVDLLLNLPFEQIFENNSSWRKENQSCEKQMKPQSLLSNPPTSKAKEKKDHTSLFKVFQNKENQQKLPQKSMEISVINSKVFHPNNDISPEIAELLELNRNYESKIDSLIAENSRISNKYQELRQEKNNSKTLPKNIENRIQELLIENKKLSEIVKNQSEELDEFQEEKENSLRLKEQLNEKESIIQVQNNKIEGLKKEIIKANKEKSEILEELMQLKLTNKKNFNLENEEALIRDLHHELSQFKEENFTLKQKLNFQNNDLSYKKEGRKKIDYPFETIDSLAIINEKLNNHLDILQNKSGKKNRGNKNIEEIAEEFDL